MKTSLAFLFTFLLGIGQAAALPLYDGSLASHPNAQGWTYISFPAASRSLSGGGSVLDTTLSNNISAGYFSIAGANPAMPVLDRNTGFSLDFSLQIQSESHATVNRGGYSVLVVSDDLRAIELAFWQNEIWAYTDSSDGALFTHGEGASFNTTAGVIDYSLAFLGETYQLSAAGGLLLTGRLRDYTSFAGFPDPYETANQIFMGDDTTSAKSRSLLTAVALDFPAPAPVPAPATLALLLPGLWLLRRQT